MAADILTEAGEAERAPIIQSGHTQAARCEFMNNQVGRTSGLTVAIKALLCGVAMIISSGCAFHSGRVSGKSWSQTAATAEREQELGAAPEGDWISGPR
jgi:hypothetical protein